MSWLDKRPGFVIAAVLLLAAVLRLHHIDQLYVDEYAWRQSDTASMAEGFAYRNWNIFLPQVRWGGAGPNYMGAEFQTVSYVAAIGYHVFGPASWVGRSISVAFGLWGIFALWNLVSRVWDRQRAFFAAAVMAVLPGAVFIERSFLPDGAMTSLMTTSLWMLVAFCQTERRRYLVAATIAGALGCLTKLPGGILLIPAAYVLGAGFGGKLRDRALQWSLLAAAIGVIVPVASYYVWARHLAMTYPPYVFAGQDKFLWDSSLQAWLANDYFLPELSRILVSRDSLWGWGFGALALMGALLPPPSRGTSSARWLFHAYLLALVVRYLLEARHLVSDPYNLHLFNIVAAAFAGHALAAIASSSYFGDKRKFAAALVAVIFAGSAIHAQVESRRLYAETYRADYVLGQTLSALAGADDLVISLGLEPMVLYHSRHNGWVFPPSEAWSAKPGQRPAAWDYGPQDLLLLDELKARGGRWLVIAAWNGYTSGSGQDFLRENYPVLHAGIMARFEIARETPDGLIFRAR